MSLTHPNTVKPTKTAHKTKPPPPRIDTTATPKPAPEATHTTNSTCHPGQGGKPPLHGVDCPNATRMNAAWDKFVNACDETTRAYIAERAHVQPRPLGEILSDDEREQLKFRYFRYHHGERDRFRRFCMFGVQLAPG
jgi:hypothetical protein